MKVVTVSAPLCSPNRASITGHIRKQLEPYQFKLAGVDAEMQKAGGQDMCWHIRVGFSDEAAEWGEYVLLRYGYSRIGRCLNAKNQGWADKYLTQPSGQWYGPGCKDRPKNVPAGSLPFANPPPTWRDQPRERRKAKTSRQTISRVRRLWWRITDAF